MRLGTTEIGAIKIDSRSGKRGGGRAHALGFSYKSQGAGKNLFSDFRRRARDGRGGVIDAGGSMKGTHSGAPPKKKYAHARARNPAGIEQTMTTPARASKNSCFVMLATSNKREQRGRAARHNIDTPRIIDKRAGIHANASI